MPVPCCISTGVSFASGRGTESLFTEGISGMDLKIFSSISSSALSLKDTRVAEKPLVVDGWHLLLWNFYRRNGRRGGVGLRRLGEEPRFRLRIAVGNVPEPRSVLVLAQRDDVQPVVTI